jgi:hypothetical protein
MNNKYVCNFNADYWEMCEPFDTLEEAENFGLEESKKYGNLSFTIGQCKKVIPKIDTESMISNVQDQVFDSYGDCADDYLNDVKKEHFDILQSLFQDVFEGWLIQFRYMPNWYNIDFVKTIDTEESK